MRKFFYLLSLALVGLLALAGLAAMPGALLVHTWAGPTGALAVIVGGLVSFVMAACFHVVAETLES